MSKYLVFPGDPEYDAPNPTRDWHYGILFVSVVVAFLFGGMVAILTGSPLIMILGFAHFVITLFTAPFDNRYG